jgi:hypothetical protein
VFNEDNRIVLLKNNTLSFSSADLYEVFLENPASFNLPPFKNYDDVLSEFRKSKDSNLRITESAFSNLEEYSGTSLLKILDKDGMVIIDKYLISLDFEKEIVGLTTDLNLQIDMAAKRFQNPKIQIFGFETDVLFELGLFSDNSSSNKKSTEPIEGNSNLRLFTCPGTLQPGLNLPFKPNTSLSNPTEDRVAVYDPDPVTIGEYQYKISAKHTYQAAAIYFRLKSELEHYRRFNDFSSFWLPNEDPSMSITYWGSFKPNNRSAINLDDCYNECQGCTPQPANKQKVQKIHHESGRRLTQVNLNGIYRGKEGANVPGALPYEFKLYPIIRN